MLKTDINNNYKIVNFDFINDTNIIKCQHKNMDEISKHLKFGIIPQNP